uniref:Uncharacterized protein n=1 Tax=Pseudomonas phage BL5 TaxID=3109218 RepID=A0AAU7B902_9VIRU
MLICLFVIWYRGIPHYAGACAISQTCLQKRRPKDLAVPVPGSYVASHVKKF